jgi:hypothetical protein
MRGSIGIHAGERGQLVSYAGSGLGAIGQLLGIGGGLVLIALVIWGFWRQLRRRGRWACPACACPQLDWQGSGTRQLETRTVEYRTYKCTACGEVLVEEAQGCLQRLDAWTPGQLPRQAPDARVVSRRR